LDDASPARLSPLQGIEALATLPLLGRPLPFTAGGLAEASPSSAPGGGVGLPTATEAATGDPCPGSRPLFPQPPTTTKPPKQLRRADPPAHPPFRPKPVRRVHRDHQPSAPAEASPSCRPSSQPTRRAGRSRSAEQAVRAVSSSQPKPVRRAEHRIRPSAPAEASPPSRPRPTHRASRSPLSAAGSAFAGPGLPGPRSGRAACPSWGCGASQRLHVPAVGARSVRPSLHVLGPNGLDPEVFPPGPWTWSAKLQDPSAPRLALPFRDGHQPCHRPKPTAPLMGSAPLRRISSREVRSTRACQSPPPSGFRVSHPLAGFLPLGPCGLVSSHKRPWGFTLQGLSPPPGVTGSSPAPSPLAVTVGRRSAVQPASGVCTRSEVRCRPRGV
jgi:hypothetical protein